MESTVIEATTPLDLKLKLDKWLKENSIRGSFITLRYFAVTETHDHTLIAIILLVLVGRTLQRSPYSFSYHNADLMIPYKKERI